MKSGRDYQLKRLAEGRLWCDCGNKATHLTGSCPECDRCRELNSKVTKWHDRTFLFQEGARAAYP